MTDEYVTMRHPELDVERSFFASQVPVFEESGWVVVDDSEPAEADAPEER